MSKLTKNYQIRVPIAVGGDCSEFSNVFSALVEKSDRLVEVLKGQSAGAANEENILKTAEEILALSDTISFIVHEFIGYVTEPD